MSLRRQYQQEKSLKRNKCVHFLLPLYGYPFSSNSPLDHYLINCYVGSEHKFFIVFDNDSNEKLAHIIENLQLNPYYVDAFFDDDNKEVVLEMKIPDEYRKDFMLFTEGKYTKFSKAFKDILCRYYGNKSTRRERNTDGKPIVKVFDAIYPTEDKLKDIADYYGVDLSSVKECGEIMDPPNLDNETFKKVTQLYVAKEKD